MVTRKMTSPTTGQEVDAEVVDIEKISDSVMRIELTDGTLLRMKIDVIEVVRFAGEWDKEGHPLYNVKSGNFMTVLDSPEHLKEGAAKKPLQ